MGGVGGVGALCPGGGVGGFAGPVGEHGGDGEGGGGLGEPEGGEVEVEVLGHFFFWLVGWFCLFCFFGKV